MVGQSTSPKGDSIFTLLLQITGFDSSEKLRKGTRQFFMSFPPSRSHKNGHFSFLFSFFFCLVGFGVKTCKKVWTPPIKCVLVATHCLISPYSDFCSPIIQLYSSYGVVQLHLSQESNANISLSLQAPASLLIEGELFSL